MRGLGEGGCVVGVGAAARENAELGTGRQRLLCAEGVTVGTLRSDVPAGA